MVLPLGILLRLQAMDIDERRRRRAWVVGALGYSGAVRLDDNAAALFLQWARQDIARELGKPESAVFTNERVVRLPDGASAGAGTVECTNAIGDRVRNWYLFFIHPNGHPFLLDIIDFDPVGPSPAGPPPVRATASSPTRD